MPIPSYLRRAAAAAAFAVPLAVQAHPGHGLWMDTAHWHATDVWGFAVVAVLAAAALWFGRGR